MKPNTDETLSREDGPLPLSRRDLLRGGLYGSAGLFLSGLGAERLLGAPRARAIAPKAKSIIQIWMWGGPSHIDTFDPKPKAGHDYCGSLDNPIATNVDGVRIGELLPLTAKHADKLAILRSMTHGVNGHETASYITQTGWKAGGRVVHPGIGAVVAKFKGYEAGYEGLIPPYIVLTGPQGRFSESGFLGSRYKPFATGGDPGRPKFLVEGIAAPGITLKRQKVRRDLLDRVNTFAKRRRGDPKLAEFFRAQEQAYDLILGDAGKVFDLEQEKPELRERYGKNTFGQSCLVARRLVEKGVPYVTINYRGWDTHKQHFETMRRKLPEMDRGLSALIEDLHERGLLDSTIVWWGGEFGRTPKVLWNPPWNGGRSHFGYAFTSVVAGGGFEGGKVVGATDERGMSVVDRPIHPRDLLGTMYSLMGIDPESTLRHPQGDRIPILPPPDPEIPTKGFLREIV